MKIELGNNEFLSIELSHGKGEYRVYVRKEFVKDEVLEDGTKYQVVESFPFANGNFWVGIKEGRYSAKFMEAGRNHLEANKERLKELWIKEDYAQMVWLIQKMAE